MSLSYLQEKGIEVERERYEMVYQGAMADEPTEHLIDSTAPLDRLYLKFNTDQPIDFKERSLSVSDVVFIRIEQQRHITLIFLALQKCLSS